MLMRFVIITEIILLGLFILLNISSSFPPQLFEVWFILNLDGLILCTINVKREFDWFISFILPQYEF
jgi:hypothetical protein